MPGLEMEKKSKNQICPKCGYWLHPALKFCRNCNNKPTLESTKEEIMKTEIKTKKKLKPKKKTKAFISKKKDGKKK